MADETEETKIIEFPEAGEGFTLLYTNKDTKQLRRLLGEKWFNDAADKLNDFDVDWMTIYLLHGGKRNGESKPIIFDNIEGVTLAKIAIRILDALYLSVHGRTFIAYAAWIQEELAKRAGLAGEENPRVDPASILSNLSAQLSGSDSNQPNSMTSPQHEPSDTSTSDAKE